MAFGENLQFLRKRAGMTQEELAEQMEVSRQSVSKWESNCAYPEMDAILRLCDLFSIDMDTLLRGDASRRFGEDTALFLLLGFTQDLWTSASAIYPVAALLCAAVTVFLKRNNG